MNIGMNIAINPVKYRKMLNDIGDVHVPKGQQVLVINKRIGIVTIVRF